MNHFFIDPEKETEEGMWIDDPSDVNHIRNVLRMKKGDLLSLSIHGKDREYICRIREIRPERIGLSVEDILDVSRELPCQITLYQGLPKGDKMEWIIQKAVELGAYRIVPVAARRSVVRLDEKKAAKKLARWQEIAKSAAKQAKRTLIPHVGPVMTFEEAILDGKKQDMLLFPYENARGMDQARDQVRMARGKKSIGIYIGPEGGFEPSEADLARSAGAGVLTLGHRILRTETAGIMLLSVLSFYLEEDE